MSSRRPGAQVKSYLREHLKGEWDWRLELRVMRRIRLPRLPRDRHRQSVWAVGVVRDEVDVIGDSIRHLLDQGVDRVLVANHLSTDGTGELLAELSREDSRVLVADDTEPGHFQMEKVTWLSQAAWWAGARWIVPFDADEFWFAETGSVAEFLRPHPASIIRAGTTHMLPVVGPVHLRSAQFLMDRPPVPRRWPSVRIPARWSGRGTTASPESAAWRGAAHRPPAVSQPHADGSQVPGRC